MMYKPLADSTLHSMTKKEIIELLRTAEHNAKVSQEWVAQQAENLKDWKPVVHGRWVSVAGKRDRICSRCLHNEPYKNTDDDAEVFEFCPHCGAKMDGGNS